MKKLTAGEINALSEKIHRELTPQLTKELENEVRGLFESKWEEFMESSDAQMID